MADEGVSARAAGLTAAQARGRLARDGPNELPRTPRRHLARIAIGVLAEPMFLLLCAAATVYLVVGEPGEGWLLATFAGLTVALVVFQEARSERALEALRELGAPNARVVRDGAELRIPASAVVVGDALLVGEGERIPADARLIRSEALEVDESLLTGESFPVAKRPSSSTDSGSSEHAIYAATLVVRGHAIGEVTATGPRTRAGAIGVSLARIEAEPTLLQKTVARLVRWFGACAFGVTAAVVALHGIAYGDWIQASLNGIAIAMSLLPEEFPMVLAVFLALGAWRLAQAKVLARRPAVIETLGAASVLCVDKTGTLTENRMRLRSLSAHGQRLDLDGAERELPETFHRLLEHAILASKRRAIDPMEHALGAVGRDTLTGTEHLHAEWPLEREYGLTPDFPAISRVWQSGRGRRMIAAKGAPETIAEICRLNEHDRARMRAEVERLADQGLRVLAVASTEAREGVLPSDPRALHLRFEGLLGFADPLRASAPAALAEARRAGIAVVMITGDHPRTAHTIAAQAGIERPGECLVGSDLDALDDLALQRAVRRVRVFARIRPEQKLRIVEAFKAAGEIVAMTGDGVNDAPALKAAHIGLAMGARGTDVAREAAGIVLLDDDFARVVAGVRLGRRIFDNLRKVLMYIAGIHLPVACLAILPLLLGLPPLLLPVHVVLIEMIIAPTCSIAFESLPEERDIMDRPPRSPRQPLIGRSQLALAAVPGVAILVAALGSYALALAAGFEVPSARAIALIALTVGNLMLARVMATPGSTLARLIEPGHGAHWIVSAVALGIVAAAVFIPGVASLFQLAYVPIAWAVGAIGVGAAAPLSFDLLERLPTVRRILDVRAA